MLQPTGTWTMSCLSCRGLFLEELPFSRWKLYFYLFVIVIFCMSSYGIAAIAPFSHRLAFDNMPEDIQKLRCKVNFQALAFVPHIRALGDALVNRLRYPHTMREDDSTNYLKRVSDSKQGNGKFVVLHLRFDKVCLLVDDKVTL